MLKASGKVICSYDLDANMVMIPDHVWEMSGRERMAWFKAAKVKPVSGGPGAFSAFEMAQPFMATDGIAVTAAAETVLTQDTILTLPTNWAAFPGAKLWFHAAGKQSNVVTTPGTYTFRLRYNAIGGAVLVASGAIIPDPVAVTDNLWFVDIFIVALATGQLTTSLTLLAYGSVDMANSDVSLASAKARFMPAGGTALANVASLDCTAPKALTLTVAPTVVTGSITCRDAFVVALN